MLCCSGYLFSICPLVPLCSLFIMATLDVAEAELSPFLISSCETQVAITGLLADSRLFGNEIPRYARFLRKLLENCFCIPVHLDICIFPLFVLFSLALKYYQLFSFVLCVSVVTMFSKTQCFIFTFIM